MEILFYLSGFFSILSVVCVICSNHPVYLLLYLMVLFLSISCNLFSLKANFAGAMEIIVYAGAIMVLFIFSIMMIDMKSIGVFFNNKRSVFLSLKSCLGAILLIGNLLIILLYFIFNIENSNIIDIVNLTVSIKQISIALFGPYMLITEMASFLLLGALISVFHIAHENKISIVFISDFYQKNKNK